MLTQDSSTVLVRPPGNRQYHTDFSFKEIAKELWEYAALCENAYIHTWGKTAGKTSSLRSGKDSEPEMARYKVKGATNYRHPLTVDGWKPWTHFPSPDLKDLATKLGLYVEVLENGGRVAVVFRGTEFWSLKDWWSNFRWINITRLVPWHEDQYTVTADEVGKEFVKELKLRYPDTCEVVATGHSLGGGLAQHFAYSLPLTQLKSGKRVKVSKVYAFDPSPVTGWTTAGTVKQDNANGLKIDRAFEHGEALAYIRLMTSYLYPPSAKDPSIREIRFNLVPTWNPVRNHSMRLLAVALMDSVAQADDATF